MQALGSVPCRAAVMQKPAPLPPGQVTALLHPNVPDALRTVTLLGAWVADGVRWLVGAVDRQNATGTQDDLKASPDTCLPHREFAHDTCLSICCWRHSNHEWVCRALSRAQHEKAAFLLALRPKKVRESQYHTHAENACGKCPCISYRHLPQAQTLVSITVGDLMHAGSPGRIAHWLCCTEHCRH